MNNLSGSPTESALPVKPLWRRVLGLPVTRIGWWSSGLFVGSLLLLGLFNVLIASGQRGGDTFFSNPWLALSILTAFGAAVAGGALALASFLRQRERSLVVLLALVFGALVAVFAIGEFAFPH